MATPGLPAFRKVTLPLMMPSITATAIFVMILSWNEFAFATFMTSTSAKTMPPAIMAYSIGADIAWNVLGAAVVLITAPLILFVLIMQRQLISGLSQGVVTQMTLPEADTGIGSASWLTFRSPA